MGPHKWPIQPWPKKLYIKTCVCITWKIPTLWYITCSNVVLTRWPPFGFGFSSGKPIQGNAFISLSFSFPLRPKWLRQRKLNVFLSSLLPNRGKVTVQLVVSTTQSYSNGDTISAVIPNQYQLMHMLIMLSKCFSGCLQEANNAHTQCS